MPSEAAETGPRADNLNALGADARVAQDGLGGVSDGGGRAQRQGAPNFLSGTEHTAQTPLKIKSK